MGLIYASIRTRNLNKSVDFYTRAMGLKVVDRMNRFPGEKTVTLEDRGTGQKLRLMWYGKNFHLYKPYEKGDEMDHLMFKVNNAEKEYRRLTRRGAPVAMKLFKNDRIAMGFVKDPDGIWVGLMSMPKRKSKR